MYTKVFWNTEKRYRKPHNTRTKGLTSPKHAASLINVELSCLKSWASNAASQCATVWSWTRWPVRDVQLAHESDFKTAWRVKNPIKERTKFKETMSMFYLKSWSEYSSCPLKESRHASRVSVVEGRRGGRGMRRGGDGSGAASGQQALSGPAVTMSLGNTHWHFRRRVHSPLLTFHKEKCHGILPMELLSHPYFNICNRREFSREQ